VKRDMLVHRLIEALAEKRCPICSIGREAVARCLEGLLYEQVNDPGVRQTLHRSKGFCRRHSWALTRAGDSLGSAILYRDQIEDAIGDVHHTILALDAGRPRTRRGPIGAVLRPRRTPRDPCPPCRVGQGARERAIVTLIAHLDDPAIQEALERSAFLCLPDLVRALECKRTREQAHRLLDLAEMKLRRLEGELADLIRKRDYRFLREPRGEEQSSWLRAIGQLVGWPIRSRLGGSGGGPTCFRRTSSGSPVTAGLERTDSFRGGRGLNI